MFEPGTPNVSPVKEENRADIQGAYVDRTKVRTWRRNNLGASTHSYAALRWLRPNQRSKEMSSRGSADRYFRKCVGFGLGHRPIKLAKLTLHGFECFMCKEVPASLKHLMCGHTVCKNCLYVPEKLSWLINGELSPSALIVCPKCGLIEPREVQTTSVCPELVESPHAHCFSAEYGCPFLGKLKNLQKHESFCLSNPCSSLLREFNRCLSLRDQNSNESAYFSGKGGNRGNGVGGAAGCVPQNDAGRPAAALSSSVQISNSVEELVQLLTALKPPTSAEAKPTKERQEEDECLATRIGTPFAASASPEGSGTEGVTSQSKSR